MADNIIAQLAALKTAPIGDLKALWEKLYARPAPVYSRIYIERRLAYRIQELAYGGLTPQTVARLDALAESLEPAGKRGGKPAATDLVLGTQLIREFRGVEHRVTVRDGGFEYQGQTYKSLSAIARRITGTRWNGLLFFGLRRAGTPAPKRATKPGSALQANAVRLKTGAGR